MGLADGTSGKAQPEHAAVGPSFSVGTEFPRSSLVFAGRQFFGIEARAASWKTGNWLRSFSLAVSEICVMDGFLLCVL